MTDTANDRNDETEDASQEGGQVSEGASLQGSPEEVTPGDATAGHPDSEDGDGPQEGTAGPDAPPQDGRPSGSGG